MSKPNFIIFLTDDQGYGDLSCMGATDFSTPNLDQMAERGVRFTDWYSNSLRFTIIRASPDFTTIKSCILFNTNCYQYA